MNSIGINKGDASMRLAVGVALSKPLYVKCHCKPLILGFTGLFCPITCKGLAYMDNYTATGIAEGFIDCESEDQYIQAWQHLIDTGLAWQLQGFFGRTARQLIDQGVCNG